jgi:hypothetical protein
MVKMDDSRDFSENRIKCRNAFYSSRSLFKRRITQGLYWTSLDKDIANQYYRDERWFCGMKFWDAMKSIDHGVDDIRDNSVGFIKTK